MEFPQVVELNVGGRHLTTSVTTLTTYPDSMLAAMFSGKHHVIQDKDGRYFIDVNGDAFEHILDFLRLQIVPPPEKAAEVKKYAKYFGIVALSQCLDDLVLSSQDAMFAQWASNIHGYSKYIHELKQQLTQCDIKDGFIYVKLSLQKCSDAQGSHEIRRVFENDAYFRNMSRSIDLEVDSRDDKKIETLFTLFTYDLSKLGFCLCEDDGYH